MRIFEIRILNFKNILGHSEFQKNISGKTCKGTKAIIATPESALLSSLMLWNLVEKKSPVFSRWLQIFNNLSVAF